MVSRESTQTGSPIGGAVSSAAGATAASAAPASTAGNATAIMSATSDLNEYANAMSEHLYKAFVQAEFSDTNLEVSYQDAQGSTGTFCVHSVIIARSPYLRSLMEHHRAYNVSAPLHITAPPHCTHTALSIALLSMYSPVAYAHLSPELGPGVLAAASLLHLPELAMHAERACATDVSKASTPEDFARWFAILSPSQPSSTQGVIPGMNGKGGIIMSNGSPAGSSSSISNNNDSTTTEHAHGRLRDLLYERLVVQLPRELGAFDSKGKAGEREAQQQLMQVFAMLPFEVFKKVIESPKLPVSRAADLERFNFAKKVVAERKRLHQQQAKSSPTSSGRPSDFDETVVLQFGAGDPNAGGTAVSVLRKQRRREYWKVGSAAQQQQH